MNGSSFASIEEAVLCFYQSNNALHGEAQKCLTELQNSPQIWNIIWEELLSSKLTELQFYGATVLHSKLLTDWAEVPAEQYDALKTKLLEAVVYFKDGERVVLNRLCISLAVFILRVTTLYWPNAIANMISLFQDASLLQKVPNATPEKLTSLLLEILSVIPEEFHTILLTKNEKIFVESALEGDNMAVLALVEAALTSPIIDVKLKALKCAKSWLEFGLPPDSCDNLLDLLIETVIQTYKNPESSASKQFVNPKPTQCYNNEISQCCINAIEAISIMCNHRNIAKHHKKVVSHLSKILLLAEIFNNSPTDITNSDLIPCLFTLFVGIGECHVKVLSDLLLTSERRIFLDLLSVILQCSDAPGCYPKDEVYSVQALNFWYLLQDTIVSNDSGKDAELSNIIKPVYKQLTLVLMKKSMMPKNMSGWSEDDKDSLRCYRQDIADTYTYCYAILNFELLDIIVLHLEHAIVDPNVVAEWRKVDSYLYAFYAISENLICSENPRILHCIMLLKELPLSSMHVRVSQTVMELLGSYAEWLCTHPELLEPVLSLVFRSAENPQLAAPATLALKDIARECKPVIYPYAEGIAEKTMELLKRNYLNPKDEVRLIFSLATVVSLLPKDTILKYLKEVASPYIVRIETILRSTPENPEKAEREVANCISIFTHLFLGLVVKPEDPVLCLLQEVLPRFKVILAQYRGQEIISSMCDAIKCAVCNLGESCSEQLPVIVDLVLTTYYHNPYHSLLELAKQLLILFGNNMACTQLMSDMLKRICVLTLGTFENTVPEDVSEHTSLFEHFYSFCTNVLKKNCNLLLNTEGINLVSLFRFVLFDAEIRLFTTHVYANQIYSTNPSIPFVLQFLLPESFAEPELYAPSREPNAGFALCAQEVATVKSASSFLCNVIVISREQDALLVIVQTHGAELVYHILIAIGKVSPRNCLEHVADVLVALSKKYCDWLSRWLNEILTPEGFPSPRATSGAKKCFIRAVLKEKANKRRVQDSTKEFSFLCRGLLNKDYIDISSSAL